MVSQKSKFISGGCVSPTFSANVVGAKPLLDKDLLEYPASSPISGIAFHHDYLQGFFTLKRIRPLLDFLGRSLKHQFTIEESAFTQHSYKYTHLCQTTNGARLRYFHNEETDRVTAYLQIPGNPMSSISFDEQMRMMRVLGNRFAFRCTRIDPAVDDYKNRIKSQWIQKCLDNDNFAGFQVHRDLKNGRKGKDSVFGWELGSVNSEKRMVIYDAASKHKTIFATRYEGRLRGKTAQSYFDFITNCSRPWWQEDNFDSDLEQVFNKCAQELAKFTLGLVAFVSRVADRLGRCPVIQWWKRFVDSVGESWSLPIPQDEPSITKSINWIKRQVAVRLAVLSAGMGDDRFSDFISSVISVGSSRVKDLDLVQIEELWALYDD